MKHEPASITSLLQRWMEWPMTKSVQTWADKDMDYSSYAWERERHDQACRLIEDTKDAL
jgi:hypothetical protein